MVFTKTQNLTPKTCLSLPHAVRQLAALALVDDFVNLLGRQVLVVVEADLHHRRGAARAETFDQRDGALLTRRRLSGLDAKAAARRLGDLRLPHDFARERVANLEVILTDRLGIYHRVEGPDRQDVS